MANPLPLRPNLEQYHKQAKDLLRACDGGDADALSRIENQRQRDDGPVLADAQLAIAREHGITSWPRFIRLIEMIKPFREALYPGDSATIQSLLAEAPELATCEPWPSAPGYKPIGGVASGCVWHRPEQPKVAQLLVDAGADVDITVAARAGLVGTVRQLLDEDPARAHAKDSVGRTALYRAGCVYGNFPPGEEIVDLLLERGAEMDFFVACTFAMVDEVRTFLRDDPSWATRLDPDGMTCLHWATRPRRSDGAERPTAVTDMLLQAGADVAAVNPTEDGMHPLHHCGEWSAFTQQVDLLVEHGADINGSAGNGWTPLDYAVDRGRKGMANSIRSRGGTESGQRSDG